MEIKLKEIKMNKNFNIKPSDAKYSINEEKKTVVCILEKTKDLFEDFVIDNFDLWNFTMLNKVKKMPNRFVGIAKCSEEDEWNIETGKLIAFSRAKDKLNKSFFKRAATYVKYVDKSVDDFVEVINSIGEKLEVNQKHRHELIETLLNKE